MILLRKLFIFLVHVCYDVAMKLLSQSIFALLFIGSVFNGFADEQSPKSSVAELQLNCVKVRDGCLYYNEMGQGVPIIVVHGGPGLDHGYLLPQLSQLAANHRVIFYDQRGSGKSLDTPMDVGHINIHQFVEDLDALRTSLGLNKFILMGHSWGGLLAMQYAVDHQDHLIGLILLNTAPADYKGQKAFIDEFGERTKSIQNDINPLFSYDEFKKLNASQITDLYRKLFSVYFYDPEKVNALNLNFNVASAQSGFKVMEEMTKTSWLQPHINLFPKLKTLMVPTLILHGKQDIVPVWTVQEIKEAIPHSEIVVLDHSDHFSYIEQPAQFFTELNHFLDKIPVDGCN
jgi:proline iminopeptidase